MKHSRLLKLFAVALTAFATVVPNQLLANELAAATKVDKATEPASTEKSLKPIDISLAKNGSLRGKLLDSQGDPVADTAIAAYRDGEQVAATKTDSNGEFRIEGLRGGLYAVASEQGGGHFRLWAPNTSPPSAQDIAMVYNDKSIVRGNLGCPESWIKKPVIIGATIVGAIILPIALHDNEAS